VFTFAKVPEKSAIEIEQIVEIFENTTKIM
jgi:hypothetical protein